MKTRGVSVMLTALLLAGAALCGCNQGSNVDSLLDSYERAADHMIAASQRISSGSPDAAAELMKYSRDCLEISGKLSALDEAKFTPAQVQRLRAITMKYVSAAGSAR